jgi:hypothetical protein
MSTPNITINPNLTSNAAGTFNVTSVGLVQGTAYPDPSTRFALNGGLLATSETIPMFGGVGIFENVPNGSGTNPSATLGCQVGRANALTGSKALTAFSVFDQAYGMINSPQSPVPLAPSGGQVMYYRLGSRARIAVACDPSLVSLRGQPIGSQVSWDFVNQRLIPFSATYPQTTITGATWANTSGGQTTFTVGTDLTADINAGDDINVSGVVSTGGTGVGFNGAFTVVSITSSTIVVSQPAASSPGTYSSGGVVLAGGGALNVEVIDVQDTNCMTVTYDPVTGFATWNYNGACAVILI